MKTHKYNWIVGRLSKTQLMIKDTALGHWRPDIRQESIEQAAPITPFSFKRKKLQPFKCGLNVAGVKRLSQFLHAYHC